MIGLAPADRRERRATRGKSCRSPHVVVTALGFALLATACSHQADAEEREQRSPSTVTVVVRDERGEPVRAADVIVDSETHRTDDSGRAELELRGPIVAQVSAPDTLVEPVAIAPTDGITTVRLWDRIGGDGAERISMHFGGDVMLGRRYLDPDSRNIIVEDEEDARRVVEDLAPLSAAADWTVVNLETVIGELDGDEALDGKRFLLQSTPFVIDALDEMGVDLVTLGNNHAYDWGDAGIESTLRFLDEAALPHVGAGYTREHATRGVLTDIGGRTVGTISFTTVNGSFVNDQLPDADVPVPADVPASVAWQYEERAFSFIDRRIRNGDGQPLVIESMPRRIGEAWRIYEAWEAELGEVATAELWSELLVTYPELQDWVARRGHGGAAPYQRAAMEAEIERLREEGADTVTVQIHGGYQFAEVPSVFVRRIARRAVDAGADMVIAHHPHVLQGVEWYDGKLIAYSLGNLVFDQDFLSTFPSAILRVVSDDSGIVEARMLPVMLDRYRPIPVAGTVAQQIIRTIDQRSALAAVSARVDGLRVGTVVAGDDEHDASSPATTSLVFERNSGLIATSRRTDAVRIAGADVGPIDLPRCTLARVDRLPPHAQIGTDLFDWGHFDDGTANGRRRRPMHVKVSTVRDRWDLADGVTGGPWDDALTIFSDPNADTSAQVGARVDLHPHRFFDDDGTPLDPDADVEVTLDVKLTRGEMPSVRMVSFHFDDTNPTADPESSRLNELVMPIEAPADGEWHHVRMTIPRGLFAAGPGGQVPNTATLLIDVPAALNSTLTVDNLRIIEWRGAVAVETPVWVEADLVRSTTAEAFDLVTSGC